MEKVLLAFIIPALLLMNGCNQPEEKVSALQVKNDSLVMVGFVKDSTLMQFVNAFNDIQSNLDQIRRKEMIISKTTQGNSELKSSARDKIKSDISSIYSLLLKNRRTVANLRSTLEKSGTHLPELEKMIDNLNRQNNEKDAQIVQLKDELARMNVKVQDLNTKVESLNTNVTSLLVQNQQKQKVIEEKTAELNTAYYIIGTARDLTDKKIITKAGGFIGLGRSKGLMPDIDKSYFTKVDITKLKAIPIMKAKVTVLTSHPKASYYFTVNKTTDSLIIMDQDKFWSMSKVLVIIVK